MNIPLEYIAQCPWPEKVWPMDLDRYIEAVPNPNVRGAVSGYLMREGWRLAMDEVKRCIDRSGWDVSPCMDCGEAVICLPDGLPCCERCAEQAMAEQ